jgi:hypothetical protein
VRRPKTQQYFGPRRNGLLVADPAGNPAVTPFPQDAAGTGAGDATLYLNGAGQWTVPAGGGGGGGGAVGNFLISGGQIVWQSAYTFTVTAATYSIGGTVYSSPESSIALDSSDPTNDRIDVIAVDTSGTVVKITGTASAQPSEPDVDPSTQLKLGIVLVTASSSSPGGVTNTSVYAENVGTPTEYGWSVSGSGFNVNSTNNPHAGSKCIEGTTVASNAYAKGVAASSVDPNTAYDRLVIYIRSKATWSSGRVLRVQLRLAGVLKGTPITIASGYWGFDSSITASYQLVSIPVAQFAVPAGTLIDEVRIVDSGGSIGFYIDDVAWQTGGTTETSGNWLTQDAADARYAPLIHAPRHQLGGADPIKLDDLAAPDDNTDLNASTAKHGLLRKLDNNAAHFLDGQGNWSTPGGGGGSGDVVGPASSVDSEVALFDGVTGKLLKRASATGVAKVTSGVLSAGQVNLASEVTGTLPLANLAARTFTVGITLDGSGSVISTGVKGYVRVPVACTITAHHLVADVSGSIVIDIWKDSYANFPPTVADTITASAKPTLSSAQKATDSTLTGWTTSLSAGDFLGFNVDSVATVTRVTLQLTVVTT